MEFVLGGLAACGAGLITNPLEVVKTRMQLQGELRSRGLYTVHYKNSFHAFYMIAKVDGILALQKGLVPALFYQLTMNGIRLGAFQTLTNLGLTKNANGELSFIRTVIAGSSSGCVGAFVGSPLYMVKTHLQAQATQQIAVGHQHQHKGLLHAFRKIFADHGIRGLWRGWTASIARVAVGSGVQLTTFSKTKRFVDTLEIFPSGSWLCALVASTLSGTVVAMFMTPFDVVSTRLYNQPVNEAGRGIMYQGFFDALKKIAHTEGLLGFYKGWTALLFRIGPHTVFSLVFWDQLRQLYFSCKEPIT